jgi:hypothetical protein
MSVKKSFVVKHGLEVADNLIFTESQKVGIGTTLPDYTLSVNGDISFTGGLYIQSANTGITTTVGIVSDTSLTTIVNIDTSGLLVGDYIFGTYIQNNTRITGIGTSSLTILPTHTNTSGLATTSFTFQRFKYSGAAGQLLVSQGPGLPPVWGNPVVQGIAGIALTSIDVKGGIASVTNLTVSGVSTLGYVTATDINVSGAITATNFYGTFSGTATTSINVIGGIASVTNLSVSGVSTFTSGIFSGSSSDTLVRITQTGTGDAFVVEDSANPDTTSFVINADGNVGVGSTLPTSKLDVAGDVKVSGVATVGVLSATTTNVNAVNANTVSALSYIGSGVNLTGIVTQIAAGTGISFSATQSSGKGVVTIESYFPIGKTIFVTQNGEDTNSGLTENDSKKTIKAAAAIAFPGDTIKVFPGVYVENNPIYLSKRVSVEGTELRNCIVTPRYTDRDLFYVNNSCHITDLSFVGSEMTNGASIVSFQPLAGVATDRFFDAARMIRMNLDFIAKEAVGYLTSTSYKNPTFVVPTGNPGDCSDDIKDIFKAVIHDLTRGGNLKCVGAGKSYYTSTGSLQHITGVDINGYSVKEATIDTIRFAAGIAHSCINNISWNGNYQSTFTQVKDLGIQADSATGSNQNMNSCANVVSAIYSCVGVVTTIIDQGLAVLGVGINTTFSANAGLGTDSIVGISSAVYNNVTGQTTILASGFSVKPGDIVEVRDLSFSCDSGGGISTQTFPSGAYGYEFDVTSVNDNGSFVINTGISTISHNYVGGGYVVNRAIGVTTVSYNNVTGIATITAPGAVVKVGQFVRIHNLIFNASGITTLPTSSSGYDYRVTQVIGAGTTFVVNLGTAGLAHTYTSGGVVFPPYSPGVGPITQGPYIRNCTNFVSGSIGMKVDGFNAEPGDQNDIGVTGSMSVDSYTQYNQGGIGVSITNGAYAQLVSIFTICTDIAHYTSGGGQCDITNSNCSFGNFGLVSSGIGDASSKSIYRYSGSTTQSASENTDTVVVSGVGSYRPYDGQSLFFDKLYYDVGEITVTDGGSGYTSAPTVTISDPTGPNGITAEAVARVSGGKLVGVDLISVGQQYETPPTVTFTGGGGVGAAVTVTMRPIYYYVESATLPSAGISTIVLTSLLNNTVGVGTTVYFARTSFQLATGISLEWLGSGTDINRAKPALGGVTIQENEVVMKNGGKVVYTSTNQSGDFRIGEDVVINQVTGTISGRAFNQSLLNSVTPLIIALGN